MADTHHSVSLSWKSQPSCFPLRLHYDNKGERNCTGGSLFQHRNELLSLIRFEVILLFLIFSCFLLLRHIYCTETKQEISRKKFSQVIRKLSVGFAKNVPSQSQRSDKAKLRKNIQPASCWVICPESLTPMSLATPPALCPPILL